jgi:hypothetical protein
MANNSYKVEDGMITSCKIENFKAIESVTIDFNKMNVLIGANSAGKTTILQALDFLFNCVKQDCNDYLKERKWRVEDIKTQISQSRTIGFEVSFLVNVGGTSLTKMAVDWHIKFITSSKENQVKVIYEKISLVGGHDTRFHKFKEIIRLPKTKDMLTYDRGIIVLNDNFEDDPIIINTLPIELSASVLKDFLPKRFGIKFPMLHLFRDYIENCASFELLAPESIRHGSRGFTYTIGKSGEKLATFLRNMDLMSKTRFSSNISALLPAFDSIETIVRGRPGWVEIRLYEKYEDSSITTRSAHISDGTLRLLALIAITELPSYEGTFLIDEIEDGVNHSIVTKLLNILYKSLQ